VTGGTGRFTSSGVYDGRLTICISCLYQGGLPANWCLPTKQMFLPSICHFFSFELTQVQSPSQSRYSLGHAQLKPMATWCSKPASRGSTIAKFARLHRRSANTTQHFLVEINGSCVVVSADSLRYTGVCNRHWLMGRFARVQSECSFQLLSPASECDAACGAAVHHSPTTVVLSLQL
jgi:hypothetical protein